MAVISGPLEWFGLIGGLVAIMIAVPPTLQMLLGAPNIVISFVTGGEINSAKGLEYRRLACHLQNQPIRNGMLRWLRVKRTPAEGIRVHCTVTSDGGYRLVYSPSGSLFEGGSKRWAVLPPSDVPVWLGIVEACVQEGLVRPFGTSLGTPHEQPIGEGIYTFSITVTAGGSRSKATAQFRVAASDPFVEWL